MNLKATLLTVTLIPALAHSECTAPRLTDADAVKLTGQPLEQIPEAGLSLLRSAVESEQIRGEKQQLADRFRIIGFTGEAAVKSLQSNGFECHVEVLGGVNPSQSGLSLQSADIPIYRCAINLPSACHCQNFQATFGPGPQPLQQPLPQYESVLNSMVIEQKHLSYHCQKAKLPNAQAAPNNSFKADTKPLRGSVRP